MTHDQSGSLLGRRRRILTIALGGGFIVPRPGVSFVTVIVGQAGCPGLIAPLALAVLCGFAVTAIAFVDQTDDPEVVFGMLIIILGSDAITSRRGIAGQCDIFLVNLERIPTNTNIWTITIKCLVSKRNILVPAIPPAPRPPGIGSLSHCGCRAPVLAVRRVPQKQPASARVGYTR